MRAFEIIYNEEGQIIGSKEIDINTLYKTEDGWVQKIDDQRIFLENHLENEGIRKVILKN